jgi:hypothetical protein
MCEELRALSRPVSQVPQWLVDAARQAWDLDPTGRAMDGTVLVREPSPFGYCRASYELNLGCNFDCSHCYLAQKRFAGLDWPDREKLLTAMRDAGVLWLQLTGWRADDRPPVGRDVPVPLQMYCQHATQEVSV